jgi:hypothetical protein
MTDMQYIEKLLSYVEGVVFKKLTCDAISASGRTVKVDAVRILLNRNFLNC